MDRSGIVNRGPIRKRLFRVPISLITLAAFLVNVFSYDLAYAAASGGAYDMPGVFEAMRMEASSVKEIDPDTFVLPEHLGRVEYRYRTGHAGRTVIHIQDAHCNYDCQRKISEIIGYVKNEYGVETVNLEGGGGDYDLSVFTGIEDKDIRSRVADYFVKEGIVNGAEEFAINNPGKISLWGIEDTGLYIDNLNAYRTTLEFKPEADRYIDTLEQALNDIKLRIYSKGLLELDSMYSDYKDGALELRDYLSYLLEIGRKNAIYVKDLSNLYLLGQTLSQEEKIDFRKADREREFLIEELRNRLSKNAWESLVLKTVEFSSHGVPEKDFYAYLAEKSALVNVDLKAFPDLRDYMVYISMYESVDKSKIFGEMNALEESIKERLYQNEKQRDLGRLSKNLVLIKNLFDIRMTKEDYRYYIENKRTFSSDRYISFIKDAALQYGLPDGLDRDISDLDLYREKAVKFYEYSFERDEAFVKNIRSEAGEAAILVTGGFHTENLAGLFRDNGVSFISIMPKFRNEGDYESPYFALLSGDSGKVISSLAQSMMALAWFSYFCSDSGEVLGTEPQAIEAWVKLVEASIKSKESGVEVPVQTVHGEVKYYLGSPENIPVEEVKGVIVGDRQVYVAGRYDKDALGGDPERWAEALSIDEKKMEKIIEGVKDLGFDITERGDKGEVFFNAKMEISGKTLRLSYHKIPTSGDLSDLPTVRLDFSDLDMGQYPNDGISLMPEKTGFKFARRLKEIVEFFMDQTGDFYFEVSGEHKEVILDEEKRPTVRQIGQRRIDAYGRYLKRRKGFELVKKTGPNRIYVESLIEQIKEKKKPFEKIVRLRTEQAYSDEMTSKMKEALEAVNVLEASLGRFFIELETGKETSYNRVIDDTNDFIRKMKDAGYSDEYELVSLIFNQITCIFPADYTYRSPSARQGTVPAFLKVAVGAAVIAAIVLPVSLGISALGPAEFLSMYLHYAGDALPPLGRVFGGVMAAGGLLGVRVSDDKDNLGRKRRGSPSGRIKVTSAPKGLKDIAILVNDLGGSGDVMRAWMLAREIEKSWPRVKITVAMDASAYGKFNNIMPMPAGKYKKVIGNITVVDRHSYREPGEDEDADYNDNPDICFYFDPGLSGEFEVKGQSYLVQPYYTTPDEDIEAREYEDTYDKILYFGLYEGSLGMIFDRDLDKLKKEHENLNERNRAERKKDLLNKILGHHPVKRFSPEDLSALSSAMWGASYASEPSSDLAYAAMARKAAEDDKEFDKKRKVLFVFNKSGQDGVSKNGMIGSFKANRFGYSEANDLPGSDLISEDGDIVINLSSLPLEMFNELFALCEMPVYTTGAVSRTTANQLDKVWLYEPTPWFDNFGKEIMDIAENCLTKEEYDLFSKLIAEQIESEDNDNFQRFEGSGLPKLFYDAQIRGIYTKINNHILNKKQSLPAVLKTVADGWKRSQGKDRFALASLGLLSAISLTGIIGAVVLSGISILGP
ncbi:MAG: hypothetical protein WCV56_07745, partial [Candidatus Omnitrophota bacterium]